MNISDLNMISAESKYIGLGKITNKENPFKDKILFPFIFEIYLKDKKIKSNYIDICKTKNSKNDIEKKFIVKSLDQYYIILNPTSIQKIIIKDNNYKINLNEFKTILGAQLYHDNFIKPIVKYSLNKSSKEINIFIKFKNNKFHNCFFNTVPFKYYVECLKKDIIN